jgi:hypothetical protein
MAALILGVVAPVPVAAQGRLVDSGEFRILVSGREAGRETFSIHRQGAGQDLRFTAQCSLDAQLAEGPLRMTTTLVTLGPDRAPSGYEVKVSGSRSEEATVRRQGARYVYRRNSDAGQEMREVRVPSGAAVLEFWVTHQFHFAVARYLDGSRDLAVVDPRQGRPIQVTMEAREPTTFTLGDEAIPVSRIRIPMQSGFWEVWYDDSGRIMRVEQPLAGFRSERVGPGDSG